ncbi:MAG TPA: sigma-70 family RNA polymerase sigma factor [Vicinamibacterales bacterium]
MDVTHDRDLVQRMRGGDERAFEEFFDAYYPRLYRFAAARVRLRDAAEDIAQATIVLAIRKAGTWRGEAALFTWLCTLCRREIAAYCRRHDETEVTVLDDVPEVRAQLETLAARLEDPQQQLERQDLARLVQLTLDYLPARYGDVLEWKYLQGLSMREIAERLDTTTKAVESLLTRARDAFRDGFATLSGVEP